MLFLTLVSWGTKNEHELFLHKLLNTPKGLGHPGKTPGTSQIPLLETQGRQTFEGEHELFGHHSFAWKTHTPPDGLRTQKVNLCALFACLTQAVSFMLGRPAPSKTIYVRPVGGPENIEIKVKLLAQLTWLGPLDPHPDSPPEFSIFSNYLWHIFCSGDCKRGMSLRKTTKFLTTAFAKFQEKVKF